MTKAINKIIICFIICTVVNMIFTIGVYAYDTSVETATEATVPVRVYYELEEDNRILLHEVSGVLIGTVAGGSTHVIVCENYTYSRTETIQIFCDEMNFTEEEREKISFIIEVDVGQDVSINANVTNSSTEMNLAILKLEQNIYNRMPAIFNLDTDAIKIADDIYIINPVTEVTGEGLIVDTKEVNGISYLEYSSVLSSGCSGELIVNSTGELLAIAQGQNVELSTKALTGSEIAIMLKTLGINFEIADHNDYSVNTSALQAALSMAENIVLDNYTEESSLLMQEALLNAQTVMMAEEHTQEEVDNAYNELIKAQENLIVEEKMPTGTIILLVVVSVLCVTVVVMVICIILGKKKRKRDALEKEELEKKKAPVNQGPYVPMRGNGDNSILESGKYEIRQGDLENAAHKRDISSNSMRLEGFAPSSTSIRMNEEDTTVLGVSTVSSINTTDLMTKVAMSKTLELVQSGSNRRIVVDKNDYVIGKSMQKADFVLENPAVSREHVRIVTRENRFYVIDLKSLNGTRLNSTRLNTNTEYELKDGDEISISNEQFIVVIR